MDYDFLGCCTPEEKLNIEEIIMSIARTALCFFVLTTFIVSLAFPVAAKDIVRYKKGRKHNFNPVEYEKKSYGLSLLKLVLESTKEEFGDYELRPAKVTMRGRRLFDNLAQGQRIDVIWGGAIAKEYTGKIKAIETSLFRGHENKIIGIIRRGEQTRFDQLSQEGLKSVKFGRLSKDISKDIFHQHGYQVTKGSSLKMLYKMLELKRIDYIAIMAYGVMLHLDKYPALTVEKKYMFTIPKRTQYLVKASNQRLFNRISKGLENLEATGAFKHHFDTHPMMEPYRRIREQPERTIIDLK